MSEREEKLRRIIDQMFLLLCKKCTEEEIQNLPFLQDLKELAFNKEEK